MQRRFRRAAPPCARRPLPPPFEAVAEKCAYGGDAIARAPDGRVAFISGALPGERVAAEPYLDKKSFVKCRAARILEPSPDRTHTPASGVPGCVYGDFSYEAEIAAKQAVEKVTPLEKDPWILLTQVGEYGAWAKMRFVVQEPTLVREARDAALRAIAPYTRNDATEMLQDAEIGS